MQEYMIVANDILASDKIFVDGRTILGRKLVFEILGILSSITNIVAIKSTMAAIVRAIFDKAETTPAKFEDPFRG
jgi:hypothetical protein